MDPKRQILNCARNGELHRLKTFFDEKTKEEISLLVSSTIDATTPLLMACKHGHVDVVSYLVEECNADIEQSGSVMIGALKMSTAPPLWCAASAGHLNVVKYLVRCKASINAATRLNSTPLRAACVYGHFEVAKFLIENGADFEIASRDGDSCLMIACSKGFYEISKYLIECGAEIKRKNNYGKTALHDCAESGNLDLLKVLLQNGAVSTYDDNGLTPLLSAAAFGHNHVVEYFLKQFNCKKEEKIHAFELLAASFADSGQGMILVQSFWRLAMDYRYNNPDCPIEKSETRPPLAVYMDATEFRTLSQLDRLRLDPAETGMQSLLVRERILGVSHHSNKGFIHKVCAIYINRGNFEVCMRLWLYVLETLGVCHIEQLLHILKNFTHMMAVALPFTLGFPVVSFHDVLCAFKRSLEEMEKKIKAFVEWNNSYSVQLVGYLYVNIFLLGLMCGLQSHTDQNERLELKKAAFQLVQLNPRLEKGWTVLHFACYGQFLDMGIFILQNTNIQLEMVNLLLEVGASPNALSIDNNSPLHIIAAINKPSAQLVFKSLLNHGAHLDLCNRKKETPLELADVIENSLDIHLLQYVNLQCLCAKAVHRYNIPYKGFVHKSLEEFLDLH